MSRIKNAVKIETWASEPLIAKMQFAIFGDKYSPEAANLVELVNQARRLERGNFETVRWSGVSDSSAYETVRKAKCSQAWQQLATAFEKAILKHDGKFFRQIADYLDLGGNPLHKQRFAIGWIIQDAQQRKVPIPTITEQQRVLKAAGLACQYKVIERINTKYFEVAKTKDKRGRKKKIF